MADYFTNFSVEIPLKDATQQRYALDRAAKAAGHFWRENEQPASAEIPDEFVELLEDWSFEVDPDGDFGIWLHSDSGGIEAACVFIKHLLAKFNSTGRVEFEWSHDCSKPRVDAYGGGAAIITAEKIATMTTSEWLRQQAASESISINNNQQNNNHGKEIQSGDVFPRKGNEEYCEIQRSAESR